MLKLYFMDNKIKVRNKKTGVIRYVTQASYNLLEDVYERLDGDLKEETKKISTSKKKDVEPAEDESTLEQVRAEYQALFGHAPDGRKGEETLKEEIEELKSKK
jgi:hypothetical protein